MEEITKIKDLNPYAKRVNVLAKVVHKGEPKEINTRYGETKHVTEAVVGDETGIITMSLWEDQAELVNEGETIYVDNGYISLVRGHMRLNVGKYGTIKKSEESIEEVNENLDMSAEEHERYNRRRNNFGRRGFGRR
ncbi:MAG: single-stranded DNA-binding protein [Thermoplasmata archaeon]|uniref:Single-stranded DNA-binding protein n=1 Tax=Candidatus Aciduliprofundum boonei TaxID=379547 RepID=A0A7J3T9P4_9ARCH|nr:single-stranded DNA-binding protein [Thermoplasmata archaeon]HHE75651.1 single-stranded DNA-binding protein [Candidatus Aciduliprofundum boonei]